LVPNGQELVAMALRESCADAAAGAAGAAARGGYDEDDDEDDEAAMLQAAIALSYARGEP
jgi:hypothetical protein